MSPYERKINIDSFYLAKKKNNNHYCVKMGYIKV